MTTAQSSPHAGFKRSGTCGYKLNREETNHLKWNLSQDDSDILASILRQISASLSGFRIDRDQSHTLPVEGFSSVALSVLERVMSTGSVSLQPYDSAAPNMVESLFAGVWCHRESKSGNLIALEICDLPQHARQAIQNTSLAAVKLARESGESPAMKRLALATRKLSGHSQESRIFNLDPGSFSSSELTAIDDAFPDGSVRINFSGYPSGQVCNTAIENVWRIRYVQDNARLALDTLEIGRLPEQLVISESDIDRSIRRADLFLDWLIEPNG